MADDLKSVSMRLVEEIPCGCEAVSLEVFHSHNDCKATRLGSAAVIAQATSVTRAGPGWLSHGL